MAERMTWEEIKEKYPDQWVGLDEVKWESPTSSVIVSAVVRYTDKSKSELTEEQIETGGRIVAIHTAPDNVPFVGVMY